MSESQTDEMIDQQVQELAERLFLGGVAAFELMTIHLGTELGLYAALGGSDGATPPEQRQRQSTRATPRNGSSNKRPPA